MRLPLFAPLRDPPAPPRSATSWFACVLFVFLHWAQSVPHAAMQYTGHQMVWHDLNKNTRHFMHIVVGQLTEKRGGERSELQHQAAHLRYLGPVSSTSPWVVEAVSSVAVTACQRRHNRHRLPLLIAAAMQEPFGTSWQQMTQAQTPPVPCQGKHPLSTTSLSGKW